MKIYFAGSFNRMEELNKYKTILERKGHTVTSRWLNGNHEIDIQEQGQKALGSVHAVMLADEDLEDIESADLMLFFSSANNPSKGRGGRHTEFGYALALGKEINIIGERECVFHAYKPDWYDFDTWYAEFVLE